MSTSMADIPGDEQDWPDDQKLPGAREILRQNSIDAELDETESVEEYYDRLVAEAEDRGWQVERAEPDGGAIAVTMRRAGDPDGRAALIGYGATAQEALIVELADAIVQGEQ